MEFVGYVLIALGCLLVCRALFDWVLFFLVGSEYGQKKPWEFWKRN